MAGAPVWKIPLFDLNFGPEEEHAVAEVLRSRWLSMGPRTEEFEEAAARYLGVPHAIAVSNGTAALELAYQAARLQAPAQRRGPNRTGILVPDITFVATANAAIAVGAEPRLIDILAPDLPILSSASAYHEVARGGDTLLAACIVHYAGFDSNSDEFLRLCGTNGLLLIEDAAHAIGGMTLRGLPLGTTGDIGCFSFFANKNLATGEGGLVVTRDAAIASLLRSLRSHGMTSTTIERHRGKAARYDVLHAGRNCRPTEIMAALGLAQLNKLDAGNERRRVLYRNYAAGLNGRKGLRVAFSASDDTIARSAAHILPLLCDSPAQRDAIVGGLTEAGIQTSHHYPAIHGLSFYQKAFGAAAADSAFPHATDFAAREVTLPLYPGLTDGQAEDVCAAVLAHA